MRVAVFVALGLLMLAAISCEDKSLKVRVAEASTISTAPQPLPRWTQQGPRFVKRGSRRFAVAVGSAQTGELALVLRSRKPSRPRTAASTLN